MVSAVVQELSVDASAQAAESARASGESALETLPAPEPAAAEHPHPQHPLVDGTTVEASSEGAGLRVEASSSDVQVRFCLSVVDGRDFVDWAGIPKRRKACRWI